VSRKILSPTRLLSALVHKAEFPYECLTGLAYGFANLLRLKQLSPKFEVRRAEASGYSNVVMDVPFCGYFDSNFVGPVDGEGHCLGAPGAI
jgi:hypothetical protein